MPPLPEPVLSHARTQLSEFRILVAPGLNGSNTDHWQTRWEALHPSFERIEQWRWDSPDLPAWSAQVGHALRRSARPAIVVAHSFGCLATVHRAAAGAPQLAGALLVAPADPVKFGIEPELTVGPLPVPSILVGSENDPWLSAERARSWSGEWGSEFVNAGPLGHINAESDLGEWQYGMALLDELVARIQRVPACRCAAAR